MYLYTVDADEFVVNKLLDRGSLSATTIVTNVQDFISIVAKGAGSDEIDKKQGRWENQRPIILYHFTADAAPHHRIGGIPVLVGGDESARWPDGRKVRESGSCTPRWWFRWGSGRRSTSIADK